MKEKKYFPCTAPRGFAGEVKERFAINSIIWVECVKLVQNTSSSTQQAIPKRAQSRIQENYILKKSNKKLKTIKVTYEPPTDHVVPSHHPPFLSIPLAAFFYDSRSLGILFAILWIFQDLWAGGLLIFWGFSSGSLRFSSTFLYFWWSFIYLNLLVFVSLYLLSPVPLYWWKRNSRANFNCHLWVTVH